VTTPPTKPEDLEKPRWSRVDKIQLIRREIREYLSTSALEVLFSRAETVVEGGRERRGAEDQGAPRGSGGVFYGTVMVTLDLGACDEVFREPADEATARRIAELMEDDRWVRNRLSEIMRPELADLLACLPSSLRIRLDHQARAEGRKVFLDGDAVVSVVGAAGAGR
jgi:hypothetical protein